MSPPKTNKAAMFAFKATHELHKCMGRLKADQSAMPFISALKCQLYNIHKHFNEVVLGEKEYNRHYTIKLLLELEKLCQWPNKVEKLSCDENEHKLIKRQYPTLARLPKNQKEVIQALYEFTNHRKASKYLKSLSRILETFIRIQDRDAEETGVIDLPSRVATDCDGLNDYQAHAKVLYNGLISYCLCDDVPTNQGLTVNLHLHQPDLCSGSQVLPNKVKFRLFFLEHPHNYADGTSCHWQDSQIGVRLKRNVKLEWSDNEESTTQNPSTPDILSPESFCNKISSRTLHQIRFDITHNSLVVKSKTLQFTEYILKQPSISLTTLLDWSLLDQQKRALLSYLLAKSVWQFYDSGWMQQPWTKDNVHFILRNQHDGFFINEPFLCLSLKGSSSQQQLDIPFTNHLHSFPKLLSLGIILLEIELGIKIQDYAVAAGINIDSQNQLTLNQMHYTADWLLKNRQDLWEKRSTFDRLKEVIRDCLLPSKKLEELKDDIQGFREEFRNTIIQKLQILYKSGWTDPNTAQVLLLNKGQLMGDTKHCDASDPVPPAILNTRPRTSHNWSQPQSQLQPQLSRPDVSMTSPSAKFPDGTTMAATSQFTCNDWFNELGTLKFVLRLKLAEVDKEYKPPRVAIIDTGVDISSSNFVRGFIDFVDADNGDYIDNTGHGTTAVRLVAKICNSAEIYVARVFDESRATEDTPRLMAKAISYAADTWMADIIIIPSGFDNCDEYLQQVISQFGAKAQQSLILAAASNYGNYKGITFPARLYTHFKLFCIFAADLNNRGTPDFNPSASKDAKYNFAILGESIKLEHSEKYWTGKSFATVIAGALAAHLIDFSRHPDTRSKIRCIGLLQTVEGMSRVFHKITVLDHGYDCIVPWKLLPRGYHSDKTKESRLGWREYICETISRALEEI